MFSGLLWYDAGLMKDLAGAVTKASARYQEKFGKTPDVCFVNSAQFAELASSEVPLPVQPKQTVLLNHIWLGVSPAPKPIPDQPSAETRELERADALKEIIGQLRDRTSVADALAYGKACEEAAQ